MSGDRFEQDLQSVLRDDAPREVPEDLRRRVAAVSSTPISIPAARPAWHDRPLLRIGVVAALAAVLALAFRQFGPPAQPGVGGGPSRSSTPTSPVPSSAPGACRAGDLSGRISGWDGAAGSRIAGVEITNSGTAQCLIQGTPGLALVDATGRVLIDSLAAGPDGQPHIGPDDPAFQLAPGAVLQTEVRVSNYCGPAPALPIEIAFTLPAEGGRFTTAGADGGSSEMAVPPCLGPTGGEIAMNGWRP
jgi:hypothetical protein